MGLPPFLVESHNFFARILTPNSRHFVGAVAAWQHGLVWLCLRFASFSSFYAPEGVLGCSAIWYRDSLG